MGCIPCYGLSPDAKLLNDCYPLPKQLLAAEPDYRPLSSDLGKLTYRCNNSPSKLRGIGEELEKRVGKEAVKSSGGYPKSRASLLISLAILRSLISECRRDLGLFSRSIIRIINIALDVRVYQKGDYDLEVVGRAASCFTAFTTYTDGAAVGVDDSLTTAYLAVLRNFAALAVSTGMTEKPDAEQLSRARLIALAGLNGAASSDALFSSNSEFSRQISILLPPLLENIFEGNMHQLKLETAKIQMDASPSPFFSEFSARRPVNDRRAPSLHAHIPGEKGPSTADVLSAALRSLHALVGLCQVNQASSVLDAVFAFLDQRGWMDVEWCCWLAEQLTAFLLLQYRFVVLTRLAEILVELEDVPPTPKHTSVLAMVTTVLNSSISLVGLGVTDLLNNLVSLIVRRIRFEPQDGLLPPLVQCISSLGTHIYYADQINDIVEELTVRMGDIPQSDKARLEILRVLIYCTIGVMTTAVAADAMEARRTSQQEPPPADKGKAPLLETPLELPRKSTSRRNPITPGVWQETLPLLGESTYAVRAAYAQALQLFLENEMIRDQKPLKPSEPAAYRFCNAVHAAVYTLAMSSCLGVGTSEPSVASVQASPEVISSEIRPVEVKAEQNGHSEPKTGEKGVSFILTEPPTGEFRSESTETPTPTRKTSRPSRRVSLPLNRLNSAATLASFDNVATPFDFAAIVNVLDKLHAAVPVAALMTGVPMLLALDRDAGIELVRRPGDGRSGAWVLERKRSIREVVALTWRRLGERWAISSVTGSADKALNSLPEPFEVPNMPPAQPGILPPPEEPTSFVQHITEGESSSTSQPFLDTEILVSSLVSTSTVLSATGQDSPTLARRLVGRWTVEVALKDSVERFSSAQVKPADDPHYDVAGVFMNLNNSSYQSFGKQQTRAVDVSDLRDALGGRVDSTPSSPPSIISTGGARSFADEAPKRKSANPDVKEVLREIFKDKKRGGTMKRANGNAQVAVVA